MNPSAPDYEPDLWNSHLTAADYLSVLERFRDVIGAICAFASPTCDIQREIQKFPIECTKEAIIRISKFVEERHLPTEAMDLLGITDEQYMRFSPVAVKVYERSGYQEYTNCYTYAVNDRDRYSKYGASPGDRAALVPGAIDYNMKILQAASHQNYAAYQVAIIHGLEADGAIYVGPEKPEDRQDHYIVAVYTRRTLNERGRYDFDMHFVREDKTGWSHKLEGKGRITNQDLDGQVIVDPIHARIGYDFMGFALVPAGGLDVGGSLLEQKTKPKSVEIPALPERKKVEFQKDIAPFAEPEEKSF